MSAAVLAAPRRGARAWRTQVGLFAAAYLAYSSARWLCVGDLETARDHANWIVDLERAMLVDVEAAVQDGLTGTPILWLLNHLYLLAQLVVVPGALVWLYRRDFRVYRRLRDTVLATWLISVPIYAAFPVAPPRLAGLGFTDTITEQTGVALDSSLTTSFYNELAAVPSLHVGFAAAVSVALAFGVRSTWARIAVVSWAPLVGLAVVATGNHFVFDVVAGLIVTLAGFALGVAVHRPLGWVAAVGLATAGLLRSRRRTDAVLRPLASGVDALVLVVNGRASGIEDPQGTARQLSAVLEELGAATDAVVTQSEEDLWEELRKAASDARRVVLVGGDGTLHAAANAPVPRLPELALVPAGRANNIARALGIPTDRRGALAVAARMPARPLDALRVATPDRSVYALESVSAGFQAEARAAYDADNSADLRQGLRALVGALRRFRPHAAVVRLPDGEMRSESTAQLFLANLPYFGFGFHVAPGADPADGRFEAILMEARGRRRLLRLLVAARRGRHLGRRGVQRVRASRARLTESLPLVADALPLGNTTATVTVEPARLSVASPVPGVAT